MYVCMYACMSVYNKHSYTGSCLYRSLFQCVVTSSSVSFIEIGQSILVFVALFLPMNILAVTDCGMRARLVVANWLELQYSSDKRSKARRTAQFPMAAVEGRSAPSLRSPEVFFIISNRSAIQSQEKEGGDFLSLFFFSSSFSSSPSSDI